MKKLALFILEDKLLVNILKLIFEEIEYEVRVAKTPKEAIENVAKEIFYVVVIGKNESTIVKSKLADIIYERSLKPKPYIIVIREPGDMIYKTDYVSVIKHPTFHQDLLKQISIIDENKKIKQILYGNKDIVDDFIKSNKHFEINVIDFFKTLKGNQKFELAFNGKRIIGFIMNGELYILYSDLQDPYSVFSLGVVRVIKEDMKIPEFLSLQLGGDVFKISFREFVFKSLEKLYDKDKLLALIPSTNKIIDVKAPTYVLEQCSFVKSNFDARWLESKSGEISVDDILKKYRYDLDKLRAIVAMYILGIIELKSDAAVVNTQFDVKIKKSFLKKIIDKIRGL